MFDLEQPFISYSSSTVAARGGLLLEGQLQILTHDNCIIGTGSPTKLKQFAHWKVMN